MLDGIEFLTNEELDALYAPPHPPVLKASRDHLTDFHIQYLNKATFFCLATGGDTGMDCSPRGGDPGLVHVIDNKTICFADWPGNNKISSLRNIMHCNEVGLLFIYPGLDIFMRINGQAGVTVDKAMLQRLSERNRNPIAAVVVAVDSVFFHCGKAINRAKLWNPESRIDKRSVPSPGVLMRELANVDETSSTDLNNQYDEEMKHGLY